MKFLNCERTRMKQQQLFWITFFSKGTDEERGIIKWRNQLSTTGASDDTTYQSTYDLPFIMPFLRRYKCFSYIPFLPTFKYESQSIFQKCCKSKKQKINIDEIQKEKYIGIPNSNSKADIEIQSKMWYCFIFYNDWK